MKPAKSKSPSAIRPAAPAAIAAAAVTCDFGQAMAKVATGSHMRRAQWPDVTIVVSMVEGRVCINADNGTADGKWHPLAITEGDIAGVDWVQG